MEFCRSRAAFRVDVEREGPTAVVQGYCASVIFEFDYFFRVNEMFLNSHSGVFCDRVAATCIQMFYQPAFAGDAVAVRDSFR
ncbi:hypothetical protein BaRGS_00032422, partial [Batillaria attramentaria]